MADKTQFGGRLGSKATPSSGQLSGTPQFGSATQARSNAGAGCAQCEAMLVDLLDGTLAAKELAAFELHRADCPSCDQMVADARRGVEMLAVLRMDRPEPRAELMSRIFAATSGGVALAGSVPVTLSAQTEGIVHATQSVASHAPAPGWAVAQIEAVRSQPSGRVVPFRYPSAGGSASRSSGFSALLRRVTMTMVQPRLAMTAAMAFFSIALTLNLTGVRLSTLRASDLRPAAIERGFYQANAHVVRYYENLRVVYELESRVRDLQQANDGLSDGGQPEPAGSVPAPGSSGDGGSAKPSDQHSTQQGKGGRSSGGTSQRQSLVRPGYHLAWLWPSDRQVKSRTAPALLVVDRGCLQDLRSSDCNEASQKGGLV